MEAEHVWAVGDVVRWHNPPRGRAPRRALTNALDQARIVAHSVTHDHQRRSHVPVEYVWSDQYDWKNQIAGDPGGDPVLVGDPAVDRRSPRCTATAPSLRSTP